MFIYYFIILYDINLHAIYNKIDNNSIIKFHNILILKIFRIVILQNAMMLDPFKFIFRICIFFGMTWRIFFL